jgi:hypothetical protein
VAASSLTPDCPIGADRTGLDPGLVVRKTS